MATRATNAAARKARREQILDAAAEAFDRLGFDALNMDWLANRAGVAKGTLYLYYPTKESLFLTLYQREATQWFAALDSELGRESGGSDIPHIAGCLVDTLEGRPRLPLLAGILHTTLERNSPPELVEAVRRLLGRHFARTGGSMESRLDFLAPGDGERVMFRCHALLIGILHLSLKPPGLRDRAVEPALAAFRLDFHEELESMLVLLLEGWRETGGGF